MKDVFFLVLCIAWCVVCCVLCVLNQNVIRLASKNQGRCTHFEWRQNPWGAYRVQSKTNNNPTKDNPPSHPTITCQTHCFLLIPSATNVSTTPSLIKTFEKGCTYEGANLNGFNDLCPHHLGIHNEVIPNKVFHFILKPLFMVERPTNPFNLDHPKANALKDMPNFSFLGKLRRNSFANEGLFPIKISYLPVLTQQSMCMMKMTWHPTHLA
jgi:hypothetical protein